MLLVLYCTVLYCTVLYCTVLYCTVLYCTVLYCTVLYCTVLYLFSPRRGIIPNFLIQYWLQHWTSLSAYFLGIANLYLLKLHRHFFHGWCRISFIHKCIFNEFFTVQFLGRQLAHLKCSMARLLVNINTDTSPTPPPLNLPDTFLARM